MFIRIQNVGILEDCDYRGKPCLNYGDEVEILSWSMILNCDLIECVKSPFLNHNYFIIILKKNNKIYSGEDSTQLFCVYDDYAQAKAEFNRIVSQLCEVE